MRDITNILQAGTPSFQLVPYAAGQSQEPSLKTNGLVAVLKKNQNVLPTLQKPSLHWQNRKPAGRHADRRIAGLRPHNIIAPVSARPLTLILTSVE